MKIKTLTPALTTVQRVLNYVATMPDDEVLTVNEMTEKIGGSEIRLRGASVIAALQDNFERVRIGGNLQWVIGNKKAIAALRKQNAGAK